MFNIIILLLTTTLRGTTPNRYRNIVDENIKIKSKNVKKILLETLSLINSRGVESLVDDFNNYLKDAKEILAANDILYHVEEEELISKYKHFINRILCKLSDPDRLDKLCLPIISTGMPEIWEDIQAYQDFSESFFDYLSSCLTGQIPRIVRSIMENLDLPLQADSEGVASKFREYFESDEAEWTDEYWK